LTAAGDELIDRAFPRLFEVERDVVGDGPVATREHTVEVLRLDLSWIESAADETCSDR